MMKKTLALIAVVSAFFLVLLSGCFTPNMKGPCCLKEGAMNGTCTMYTPPGPDDPKPTTEFCNGNTLPSPDGRVCNTLYCVAPEYRDEGLVYVKYAGTASEDLNCTNISLTNKSEPCNNVGYCVLSIGGAFASYPICTERKEIAYDESCKTMICGNIKYSPLRSLLPTASANPMYQPSYTGETKGLYNAMCNFFVLDKKTMRKINKGSNIFVNTLRFGAGISISDFEVAKLYFPMSDKFCGFSPTGNAGILRDRYMNYLDLSAGTAYNPVMINATTCAGGTENFPPAGGTAGTGYLFNTYTEGTGQFATSYVLPDPVAYENALYKAYWPSIRQGTLTSSPISTGSYQMASSSAVPYECAGGSDCFSGICAMQDFGYERSYCEKNDGTLANCLCREYGARGQSDSQVRCKSYLDQDAISVPTQKICSSGIQITTGTGCCYTDISSCTQWGYDEGSTYCVRYDSKCVQSAVCDSACANSGSWWSNPCSGYDLWGEYANPPACTADGFNGYCSINAQISTNVENCEAGGAAGEIIFLTNKTKDNYTGYVIMDGSQFPETMFYKRCGLSPADYDVFEGSALAGSTSVPISSTNTGGMFVNWTAISCVEWEPPPEPQPSGGWFYFTPPPPPPPKCAKATSIVLIKSTGECRHDQGGMYGFSPVESFPQLNNTLGWCEPCTSVTMLGLDLDSTWDRYSSFPVSCVPSYREFGQMEVMGNCSKKIKPVIDNLAAFRDRVDHYLKAGVMPVIWYTRGGFGASAQVVASRYKICGPCNSVLDPSPGIDYLREILVGMRFYYPPDFTSFFVNVSGGCGYDNHCTYLDKPDCPCPLNAAPPPSIPEPNTALGEFGDTIGGTGDYSYPAPGEKGASLGWFSCSTTYGVACSWTAYYDFFKKAIGNSGSLVIVATDSMDDATIISRAYAAKQTCPNCLIAIYSSMDKNRLDSLFNCNSGELSCRITGSDIWKTVDVIAYDENLNVRSVTDKNATMISETTNRGRELISRYGKPSFPYNFVVDDSLYNWDQYGDTKEAMTNLLKKREDIVTSGIFAIYYKQLLGAGSEPLIGDSLRDQKFCAFQQAMNNYFQPIKKKTIFIATPSVPSAECSECTNSDILFKTCNMTCDNGVKCTLPSGQTNQNKFRCPAKTIVEPCRMCNDSFNTGANVICNMTYNDNTVEEQTFVMQSLSDLYGDVISSLPKNEKCCLSEQINDSGTIRDYTYSYSKISGEVYGTMPVTYPRSGDRNMDCGLVGDDISFCGVSLDIKDYAIDCWVQRP